MITGSPKGYPSSVVVKFIASAVATSAVGADPVVVGSSVVRGAPVVAFISMMVAGAAVVMTVSGVTGEDGEVIEADADADADDVIS